MLIVLTSKKEKNNNDNRELFCRKNWPILCGPDVVSCNGCVRNPPNSALSRADGEKSFSMEDWMVQKPTIAHHTVWGNTCNM